MTPVKWSSASYSLGGHAKGVTPLHLAASDGLNDVVDVLMANGADISATDALYGGTPEGWARHHGQETTAAKLHAMGEGVSDGQPISYPRK